VGGVASELGLHEMMERLHSGSAVVREGRVELPRPFGHRTLGFLPGTDSAAMCRLGRLVSSPAGPCRSVVSGAVTKSPVGPFDGI
jgi:hypothetical protein